MKPKVTNEDFVEVWQAADSCKEAAKRLGMKASAARSRAHWLRGKGVPLKAFPTGAPAIDVEGLRARVEAAGDGT